MTLVFAKNKNARFRRRRGVYRKGGGSPLIITATANPAASSITDGETLADMTNWATYAGTGNYSSTADVISTVVAKLDGTTRTGTYAPAVGSYTLTFTVTDASANERVFNAGTLTVAAVSGWANADIFNQGGSSTTYLHAIDQGSSTTTYNDIFEQGASA